ncbi:MAG TPA: F0F1 ATP synthase subunit B [Candidatus Limnocylindrales bacterium]
MAFVDAGQAAREVVRLQAEAATPGLTINLFWIIVAALNFLVFFAVLYLVVLKPIGATLRERRARIEQGIHDADQARIERAAGEAAALAELHAARREAREILERAQKLAEESRAADVAATREELERMRVRASAEIEAEKTRAIADLRTEVATLALDAAGRVVGETMSSDRQRRLVEEYLAESAASARPAGEPAAGGAASDGSGTSGSGPSGPTAGGPVA